MVVELLRVSCCWSGCCHSHLTKGILWLQTFTQVWIGCAMGSQAVVKQVQLLHSGVLVALFCCYR